MLFLLVQGFIVIVIGPRCYCVRRKNLKEGRQGGFEGANGVGANCASRQAHLQVNIGVFGIFWFLVFVIWYLVPLNPVWYLVIAVAVQLFIGAVMKTFDLVTW